MRTYGALNPLDLIEAAPQNVQTVLLTGGTAQAMDWAGSTVGSTDAEVQLARFSAFTSGNVPMAAGVNIASTNAAVAAGTSASTLSAVTFPVVGARTVQVPQNSTGFSVVAPTSGYVMIEMWRM